MPLILVTGAPGWIGSRFIHSMFSGLSGDLSRRNSLSPDRVRCLVMPGADAAAIPFAERIETVDGDLRDPESAKAFCRDAEGAVLFHCAGVVHPSFFTRDFFDVNVRGTRNLLQSAENAGVRRVVALSSNSPFGVNPRREHRFDEASPYNPYMAYGRSKMLMELAVQEFQARGRMETVILRPTWFYGPGQPARQTTFFSMIKNGKAPIVGDGGNLRSMVYVGNLCRAMLLSGQNQAAKGQSYWVADPRPYSMNEIVDTVERLMETEFGLAVAHKRMRLPSLAGEIAGLCDASLQKLGLYVQKIHVLSEMNKTIACSVEKAKKELGYDPDVELEEGMRRSLAWCMERGISL